jgi:tetratricopeptide (TPR) repeat protein
MNRAFTLAALGYDKAAVREIDQALAVTPVYDEPYKLLGKIYAKHKQYEKAFENFRIALLFDPKSRELRYNLALACYDLGKYKYSADQYQRIIDKWPGEAKAHFLMARALAGMALYDKAVEFTRHAHVMVPEDIKDLLKLGDLLADAGQFRQAEEVYTLGLETKKRPAEVHRKLSAVYEKLGEPDKAREEAAAAAKAGLEETPEEPDE